MFLCYIDESGTPEVPGNSKYYVLAGIAIPITKWKDCENDINRVKGNYALQNDEIHTAWLSRKYIEQSKIPNFETLNYHQRRFEVEQIRNNELLKLQRSRKNKLYIQTKKNYKQTNAYIHLTYNERIDFLIDIAKLISGWGYVRLFAECIDKFYFDPAKTKRSIAEQGFEQVVSRFEHYLSLCGKSTKIFGLLIHDNNETVAKKHTELMKNFHANGTFWTGINNIIETPLFVNSELTSMIQIADLCSYSLRRYLENAETDLFKLIFTRADTHNGKCVGVRHFTNASCTCIICQSHK